MSRHTRDAVEHNRREQQKRDRWTREERIEHAIELCSRALGRAADASGPVGEYYDFIEDTCRDTLIPLLEEHCGHGITQCGYLVDDGDTWDFDAIVTFTDGRLGSGHRRQQVTKAAFRSLATLAEAEEIVSEELRNRADVVNSTVKVGEHLQDWDMELGDPVRGVALETEALKTLYCGGTGDGKSTALETEAEDFLQQTFREGRDYKLIDLVDIDKGENWFYDIPQQQPTLRRIREEEMGLAPSFADGEELGHADVEILCPLTPGLSDERLPYDTERESFTVQPFTIPASAIPKRILVPTIMSRLSNSEEQTVRQAYDTVDRYNEDWSLADLADEIRDRDELSPKHKKNAVGVIRSLQDLGYIRTAEHDHSLDWDRIFRSTETVTVFSQAKVETELGMYMSIAYLVDRILDLRKDLYGIPDAVLLMREMWKVTPQRGRLSPDERAAAVQEALANRMGEVMRRLRHFDMHLLCDTQEPGDLHKQIREMFNRYVVFSATRDTVDKMFSWTSNDRRGSFWGTLNQKKGQAGIVGKVEPAVQERDIEFLSPVAFVPPSFHHYDKDRDTNGWRTRTEHIDREALRRPNRVDGVGWGDGVPEELEIEKRTEDTGPDVEMRPVAAFAHERLELVDETHYEWIASVRTAFNEYLEENDREPWDFDRTSKCSTFGKRLRDYFPEDSFDAKQRRERGDRRRAYVGIKLTE